MRWRGEKERSLALSEFKPEIVDGFCAGGGAPGGDGAGGEVELEPIREGFGRGESQIGTRGRGAAHHLRRDTAAAEAKEGRECGEGLLSDDEERKGGGEDEQETGWRGREYGGEKGGGELSGG